MSRTEKRQRLDSKAQTPPLNEPERKLYELIKSRTNMGIWTTDMRKETGLQILVVTKSLKSLQSKNLIKEVTNIKNKTRKYYMAVEFEPSEELSGGAWYTDGNFDRELISVLRKLCTRHIEERKVATVEDLSRGLAASAILKMKLSMQQIQEVVRALVLDKEIEELKSTGVGDFKDVQVGKTCYRILRGKEVAKGGAFSSIPCGVCPRISECTPKGLISPRTCVYYNKWLEFEF